MGRWLREALEKGCVVRWRAVGGRVRVGRLDDWVEGKGWDEEVTVRLMERGEGSRWRVKAEEDTVEVTMGKLRVTAWTGCVYDDKGEMLEALVEDEDETLGGVSDVQGGWGEIPEVVREREI